MIELIAPALCLQYVIVFKELHHGKLLKIAFSLPCRFLSLRILMLISANTQELYKSYLMFKPMF